MIMIMIMISSGDNSIGLWWLCWCVEHWHHCYRAEPRWDRDCGNNGRGEDDDDEEEENDDDDDDDDSHDDDDDDDEGDDDNDDDDDIDDLMEYKWM